MHQDDNNLFDDIASDESDDEQDELFDVEKLQAEVDGLDDTFDAARDNLTQRGPWRLPEEIESKFKDVAKKTLAAIAE